MTDPITVLELAVDVPGTLDDIWTAIATGPGMSSWYVPSTAEEHAGGSTTSRFGEGPEMLVSGRVAAWEPPRRVLFDGGDEATAAGGMTFEWTIEDTAGGHRVRLVNTGFPDTPEGQAQKAAMTDGWGLFLHSLQLHLEHFRGQVGVAMLPMATGPGPRTEVWRHLTAALGVPSAPAPGDRLQATADDAPALAGRVVQADSWRVSLVLDEPAPGTGIIAVEGDDENVMISVWLYLYGDTATATVERDAPRWAQWLAANAVR